MLPAVGLQENESPNPPVATPPRISYSKNKGYLQVFFFLFFFFFMILLITALCLPQCEIIFGKENFSRRKVLKMQSFVNYWVLEAGELGVVGEAIRVLN